MTYLSDSDLMTPEKTLTVYLDTLKTMDVDQMGNYLGLESLLNTSDSAKNSIASALVDQVIKPSTTKSQTAISRVIKLLLIQRSLLLTVPLSSPNIRKIWTTIFLLPTQ